MPSYFASSFPFHSKLLVRRNSHTLFFLRRQPSSTPKVDSWTFSSPSTSPRPGTSFAGLRTSTPPGSTPGSVQQTTTPPNMGEREVSSTRLYLGNIPVNATKADIENHFNTHGTGEITEIKLMNGFGFIEYKDSMDARDVVPDGSDLMGNRLVVQFARGNRQRDPPFHAERPIPRTRRTIYRMSITGLPAETSWQDLKDFARQDGLDVVYSEVSREHDGKGFVEYETEADLKTAVEKIDNREFKGQAVHCVSDIQPERPRDRFRSRSPPPRRGGYGPPGGYDDYYDRRGPPRGGERYRDRSPPPRRDYYDSRDRGYGRSPPPPRGRPPVDDYPPPRRPYPDDGYAPRGGGGYGGGRPPYDDPYANGYRGGYDRPRSPRGPPPPRGGYDEPYDRRAYW